MSNLIAVVNVRDADGNNQTFRPGDRIPEWAEKLITNPKAWDSMPAEAKERETPKRRGPGRPAKSE